MTRRNLLALFVAAAATALPGCSAFSGDSYRFKMTVEVETPQGVRSGSSVFEVSAGHKTKLTSEDSSRYLSSRGEAVAIDIAPGRTLFALLKTGAIHGDVGTMSMSAMDPAFRNDMPESVQRIIARQGIRSPAQVSPDDYPLLVTFRDIRDPKSVARVDPADFAATFGLGARLKGITVAVTDEPITSEIESRLGWLKSHRDSLIPNPPAHLGDPSDPDLRLLDTGAFSTEIFM